MRLLTVEQVNKEKGKIQADEALRIARFNEQLTTKLKELNEAKLEYARKSEQMQADFDKFSLIMEEKKMELRNEVSSLESARQAALKPITLQKKEVLKLMGLQKEKEERLRLQEEENEKTRLRLVRLSDRLEDREYDINEMEHKLAEKSVELTKKEIELRKAEGVLSRNLAQSQKDFQIKMSEFEEKERVLSAGMEFVNRRQNEFDEIKKKHESENYRLSQWEQRLAKHYENLRVKGLI